MSIARQFILFIKVVGLLYCQQVSADSNTQTAETPGRIRQADCRDFINDSSPRVTCGFFDLPSNHDESSTNTISIPVLIANQTKSIAKSDKAILIPGGGGPGGPVGFGFQGSPGEYLEYFTSLRASGFDIVIVDQRGAGFSTPTLKCSETVRDFKSGIINNISIQTAVESYRKAIAQCRQRLLDKGIQLEDFDTYQSAKDFIHIMDSLPYTWWGTLATSYATAIAQAIEILEPSTFGRIVLDSPVPMDFQKPYTLESSKASLTRILLLCENTNSCNKKHRNITQKFNSILDRASAKPYELTLRVIDDKPNKLVNKKLVINDTTLMDMLIIAAYNNYYLATIPQVIDELLNNRVSALTEIAEEYWYGSTDLDFAEGLSWTVHCKERLQLESEYLQRHPEQIERYSADSRYIMQQEKLVCEMWDVGTTNKLQTDKPFTPETLIITGDLDPVISSEDVNNTANDFSNRQVTSIAGMGHSAWYQSECTRNNVTGFFTGDEQDFTLKQCNDGITRFK